MKIQKIITKKIKTTVGYTCNQCKKAVDPRKLTTLADELKVIDESWITFKVQINFNSFECHVCSADCYLKYINFLCKKYPAEHTRLTINHMKREALNELLGIYS